MKSIADKLYDVYKMICARENTLNGYLDLEKLSDTFETIENEVDKLQNAYETLSFQHDRLKYQKERQDKALEIIKNHLFDDIKLTEKNNHYVVIYRFETENGEIESIAYFVSKDEYDLLKETLK